MIQNINQKTEQKVLSLASKVPGCDIGRSCSTGDLARIVTAFLKFIFQCRFAKQRFYSNFRLAITNSFFI